MRIYLACTVRGDRGGVLASAAICERLQRHGHEVLTTHLLADNVEAAESQLSEDHVYRRDLDWLARCDVLVAEASGSSYGVGFEVGYVLGGGYARYSESKLRADKSPNPTQRDTNTGALQFGGGVDVRRFGWLGFRGEVRDVYTGARNFSIATPGPSVHNVVASGGLVVRF